MVCFLASARELSILPNVQTGSAAHPASYSMGYWALPLKHEDDHSPPSSTIVKNEWRYTTIPPVFLYGMHGTISPSYLITVSFLMGNNPDLQLGIKP
jgi:hypothetical protein